MENLSIEDTIQKENITFYQYSEFESVKSISRNVHVANFKTSQKTIALKCISLNTKFTMDNLINEIKRYRKLKIHDGILKFYGITKQGTNIQILKNTNIYMIILEYSNNDSLRQFLKNNFQKLDWDVKLILAKQIANILMYLHSNDIIYGRLNSENIFIHNGNIKLNVFGSTNIMPLRFLTNALGQLQYMDSQYLELFNITGKKSSDIFNLGIILWEISSGNPLFEMESSSNVDLLNNIAKGKREMAIPGTPQKYKEIYSDCWKHNGNSRPDIFQVVKNLSEIIISETPYNVKDFKLENFNMQDRKPEIKSDHPFTDVTTEVNNFINDLFEFFIDVRKKQISDMRPIMIKNYIREHKKNPAKILFEVIRHPSYYLFTSLLGFFYRHGIGTVVDNQMAIKFFNLAANEIIDTFSSNSSSLMKLYNINKEISIISLADMYLDGLGVEKDTKKAFQIYYKVAGEGSNMALNSMAYCYDKGFGVEKNEEKAFELYLKSAEKGNPDAQFNISECCMEGIGIEQDKEKGFQLHLKFALSGNMDAIHNTGYCYEKGIGTGVDYKLALKWYFKGAEKGNPMTQYNLGRLYGNGYGINQNPVKAFEWYKKSAENEYADAQYMVGRYFYEGRGIRKDIIKGLYWLNKAKENGNKKAIRLSKRVFVLFCHYDLVYRSIVRN
ncbi:hypothetical protein Glove_350g57 [Diversispora epigaea]|uniref:Protein kinase domain-containing protein n=1 Tax=Diversispora epigaea TaxID=1348612 RepID=A0A397HDH3_9GLOM|nr:hypothetical protein Glove_350g57 [Diversispora epigaea]